MNFPEQILVIREFVKTLEQMFPAPVVGTEIMVNGVMKAMDKKQDPPWCAFYDRRGKMWEIVCRDYWIWRESQKTVEDFCLQFEKEYESETLVSHMAGIGIKSSFCNNPNYIFVGKATY